jgi:hypothetical protein
MVCSMSTEQTESTTRLPAVAGSAQEQQPSEDAGTSGGQPTAEWGAAPPPAAPKSKWTTKRIVVAAVVAVGIAAAGGAAIYAASGAVDNSQGGPGGMGGPGGGRMVMGGPMSELQHGEFQTGDVTAISADSITVKSEDGYEETYVVNDDTQLAEGVEQGDEVTVVATTENDTATATSVIEFGTMPNGGQNNRQNGNNQQPPNGTPPGN